MSAPRLSRNKHATRALIVLTISFLCISIYQILYFYGAKISGKILKDLVQDQTNNLYQLDYQDIRLSFVKQKLNIYDASLTPQLAADTSKITFKVKVPEIELNLTSVFDLYTNNELSFESIAITDPNITMTRWKKDTVPNTFSIETGDLYKLINDYLIKFSIDSLDLKNGSILYDSKLHNPNLNLLLSEINFQVKNLLIDSSSTSKKKFFSTDEIHLRLTNQRFNLSDSAHFLSFDEFILSTNSQNILIRNLNIKERDSIRNLDKELNKYDISIPLLSFRGIDFLNAYAQNELKLDSVRIINPIFNVERKKAINSNFKRNDIAELAHSLFGTINIGKLVLENASTSIFVDIAGIDQHIKSNNTTVEIEGFRLDSTNFLIEDFTKLFSHFRVESSDQSFLFSDSSHAVSFKHLLISSSDSVLEVDNFHIKPIGNHNQKFNIEIPGLALDGLDILSFLKHGDLSCQQLFLKNSLIDLNLSRASNTPENLPIKAIHIQKLSSHHDKLKINSPLFTFMASDLSVELDEISMDSLSNQHLLNNVNVQKVIADKIHFDYNEFLLTASQFKSLNHLEQISLNKLQIHSDALEKPIDIEALFVNGLKPHQLLDLSEIKFDSLHISKPQITLPKSTNDAAPFLRPKIQFKNLVLSDGNLEWPITDSTKINSYSFDARLRDFAFDTLQNQFYFELNYNADSIVANHLQHGIRLFYFDLSTQDSTLHADSIFISPLHHSTTKNQLSFIGRALNLQDILFNNLFNTGAVVFSRGAINDTQLELQINELNQKTTTIPLIFDLFETKLKHAKISIPDFELSAKDLQLSIESFDPNQNQLLAKNYNISCEQFLGVQPSKNANYELNNFSFSTESGRFYSRQGKFKTPAITGTLDSSYLSTFNLLPLLNKEKLSIDSVFLNGLNITPNLNYKNSGTLPVDISNFSLINGHLLLPKLELNKLSVNIDGIHFNPNNKISTLGEIVDDFQIGGENFNHVIDDSLFNFRVGKYAADFSNQTLLFEKIRLEPRFNRGEFQNQINFQKDWFDGVLATLSFNDFSFDSLIFGNKLESNRVIVNHLDLDTHRDKRIPPAPGTYKPLPQTLISQLPFKISIDTLTFANCDISHSEFSEKGVIPGVIFFRNLKGSIINFSNTSEFIQSNKKLYLATEGTLMNTGDFVLQVKFDMNHPQNHYSLTGHVGNMDLTEINRFLNPTAFVNIRSGNSKNVTFNFNGNEEYAMGEMRFYYDDLKISVIDQETYDTRGLGPTMRSFFANTFVVNTRNPHFLIVRDGDIFYERNKEKSIFNYWGRSLLSGVVSSIGASNNKKEIKQKNEEIRKQLESTAP